MLGRVQHLLARILSKFSSIRFRAQNMESRNCMKSDKKLRF